MRFEQYQVVITLNLFCRFIFIFIIYCLFLGQNTLRYHTMDYSLPYAQLRQGLDKPYHVHVGNLILYNDPPYQLLRTRSENNALVRITESTFFYTVNKK